MSGVDVAAPTVVRALHIGRRDHYRLAAGVLLRRPRRVVLMQRSSSLVLGAEAGWDDEAAFLRSALATVAAGATWYHIASSAGIATHLARPSSCFPDRGTARRRLLDRDGVVSIGRTAATALPVRDLPTTDVGDFKIDRQARLLAADFGDDVEAVVVTDIGDRQCSIHHCGPLARALFDVCVDFWGTCPPLRWDTIAPVLAGDEPADPGDRRPGQSAAAVRSTRSSQATRSASPAVSSP